MDTTEDRRCEVDIHITSQGDVNIYNCATVPTQQPLPVPGEPAQCPPTLPPTGACVSLALGSKPKQSLQAKLNRSTEDWHTERRQEAKPERYAAIRVYQCRVVRFRLVSANEETRSVCSTNMLVV
jgi:hypothetical protein